MGSNVFTQTAIHYYSNSTDCTGATGQFLPPSQCTANDDLDITALEYEEYSTYGGSTDATDNWVNFLFFAEPGCGGDIIQQDSFKADTCVFGVVYSCDIGRLSHGQHFDC